VDGHIFTEITLLIAVAAGIAMIMRFLKQPLIIGYIFTGLIVGPSMLGFVKSYETVGLLGEFGIALLLFVVGLGLNPKVIKEVGKVAVFTGIGQVFFTVFFASFLTRALGYSATESLYMSIALAFSSTIIILKLLSDKKEQNKLYGKISIGFLLVQDILATFALIFAATAGQNFSGGDIGILVAKGIGITAAVIAAAHFIIRPMTKFLSRSQELLFLFAIAWGFGIGTIFYESGFSLEVGALLAGIALASMSYAQEVASRLKPLRDFFLIVFFISLGSQLNIGDFASYIGPALAMSALVLFGNPIIVMTIMGLLGYTKRTSFKSGLAVAQISEFSLIFLIVAGRNGQIGNEIIAVITLVAIITIAVSTYMITYSDKLYSLLEEYLKLFERRKHKPDTEKHHTYDAVLFGYKRGGHEFVKVFKKIAKRYIVVDYDPDVTDELERKQVPYLYGDATDPELLEEIDLTKTRLVVSLASDYDTNLYLLKHLESINPRVVIICHADTTQQAAVLYGLGASYVIMPTFVGSEKISAFIKKNGFSKTEFHRYREKHIAYLQSHYDKDAVIET
jgi:Kef-type K+ transport system membrane component KefB